MGKKSKQITQQVLEVNFGEFVVDSVFIIVPELIRDCIMGIEILQEGGTLLIYKIIKLHLIIKLQQVIYPRVGRC